MSFPLPTPESSIMFLLRHGATDNNLAQPPRLQGCGIDGSLSNAGQRQAHLAARCLHDLPIAAVYSSPLIRARETAEAVAVPHELAVTTVSELIEVDVGRWEGRSWVDIEVEEPEDYHRFQTQPDVHGYAGGENLQQVRDRVTPAFSSLLEAHLGQAFVVVGHNVVNRAYLSHLAEIPLGKARSISQDNCGINIVRFRDGAPKLVTLNQVIHLHDIE